MFQFPQPAVAPDPSTAAASFVAAGYQGEPILPSGSAGREVAELCARLAAAGYPTQVSRGEAPAELTSDVYAAVEAFRRDHGVVDEFADRDAVVGPSTWAALPAA